MASLDDKIVEYLAKHPNSKARQIADALHFVRREINQALYNNLFPSGVVQKNSNDEWDLSGKAKQSRAEAAARQKQGEITISEDHARALEWIKQGKNVFVTGKAGTGKTTLLRKIRKDYEGKRVVVTLAPTGVAAENADGYTLHSFLRLPLSPYAPNFKKEDLYSLEESTIDVVRNLDMIIIDEISMVRCDMLDAADAILRHYRDNDKPFGGIQLIMFGDLYQLMPVAKAEDWEKIEEFYQTPYFFSSAVLCNMEYYICELNQVFRQKDDTFVQALNNIRVGAVRLADINLINSRYVPTPDTRSENAITLMTCNRKTKKYNDEKLEKIDGEAWRYDADVVNWKEKLPTDKILFLKPGARVMFVKNDNQFKKFVNGTMGWVEETLPDSVIVRRDKSNELIRVEKQRWDQFRFYFDKKTKSIMTEIVGSFSQIPLKLAWAVTVHKSQGLTFDEVDIDAADSFTYGQIYVALSRCRSLKGIRLLEKIPSHKIMADNKVLTYLSCIGENGRVKPLPSFKIDLRDYNSGKYDVVHFPIRDTTYDSIMDGRKNYIVRNIHSNKMATEVFESKNNKLLPNDLFSHVRKEWKFNDMNDGNCPFKVRNCPFMVLSCKKYNKQIVCAISDNILVQANADKTQWQIIIVIDKILSSNNVE